MHNIYAPRSHSSRARSTSPAVQQDIGEFPVGWHQQYKMLGAQQQQHTATVQHTHTHTQPIDIIVAQRERERVYTGAPKQLSSFSYKHAHLSFLYTQQQPRNACGGYRLVCSPSCSSILTAGAHCTHTQHCI